MHEYIIDLNKEPEHRWLAVDIKPIRLLVEEAESEIHEHLPSWLVSSFETATRVLRHLYRDLPYVREIEGLAVHTDTPVEKLLLLNLSYDLASCGVALPGMLGCTGALIRLEGELRIARTMDWSFPSSITRHTTLYRFRSRWNEVLSVGFPGFVGVVSGLNSHGIAITLNQAFHTQIPNHALPVPWLIRETLEQYIRYPSALSHLTSTTAASSGFYLITDGDRGALVESTGASDLVFHHHLQEKPALVVANHFHDDVPGEREWGDSFARHEKLSRSLSRLKPIRDALCVSPVEHGATAHQLVLDPKNRSIDIRCPSAPKPSWKTYGHRNHD